MNICKSKIYNNSIVIEKKSYKDALMYNVKIQKNESIIIIRDLDNIKNLKCDEIVINDLVKKDNIIHHKKHYQNNKRNNKRKRQRRRKSLLKVENDNLRAFFKPRKQIIVNNEEQLLIDDYKRYQKRILFTATLQLHVIKRELIKKQITEKKNKANNDFLNAILMYNELKRKLNIKINELNKDIRKRDINTNDTMYMTYMMESLALSYTKASEQFKCKKEINFSSNTFCDRRLHIDASDFDQMTKVLTSFINDDLKIECKIYAVDGSKLSMSLEMNKYGFPMARQKSKKGAKISKLQAVYKSLLTSIRTTAIEQIKKINNEANIKIKKIKIKNIGADNIENNKNIINKIIKTKNDEIVLIKNNKKDKIKKLIIERKQKIKNIKEKKLNDDTDYEICTNKTKATYCKGLLTVIFDVENKMAIKMDLTTNLNERLHIMSMIDNTIKPGSIMIFDRGYYSDELLKFLHDRGIIPIFRLCSGYLEPKSLNKNNKKSDIFDINGIAFKVIKYEIDNSDYYVGTTDVTLTNKKLETMYWWRWSVEEFYKKVKHTMKGEFFNVHHKNTLYQTLSAMQFTSLYTSIIMHIAKINKIDQTTKRQSNVIRVNREKKSNFKDALDICIRELLYDTLCNDYMNSYNDSRIIFLLNLVYNSRYINITGRHNMRHSILFRGKWSFH